MDITQATKFYEALTNTSNPQLTFQWFCDFDKTRKTLAGWENSTLANIHLKLVERQSVGCGVFTCVNGASNGGRGKADMDIFRAVFMDSDGAAMPASWPVTPHAIVKRDDTHYHAYWFIDGDCSAVEWMIAQKQIALHFGSDESMVNPDRVMRIPGFVHQKSLDNKAVYALDTLNADMPRYKLRDIIGLFTLNDEKMVKMGEWVQSKSKGATVTDIADFDDNANNCDQFIKYLRERAEQSISGVNGNSVLFKTAAFGRDFRLSPQKTYELMLAHWDDRNDPPWGDEMWPTINNVYKYSENGIGAKSYSTFITAQVAQLPGMSLTPPADGVRYTAPNGTVYESQEAGKVFLPVTEKAPPPEARRGEESVAEALQRIGCELKAQQWLTAAEGFVNSVDRIFTIGDTTWIYDVSVGRYHAYDIDELKGCVYNEMVKFMENGGSPAYAKAVAESIRATTQMFRDPKKTLDFPAWIGETSADARNPNNCILMKNGIYDLDRDEFVGFSSDMIGLIEVDYNYNPAADCPTFKGLLSDMWDEREYDTFSAPKAAGMLQMWFGYNLILDSTAEKSLWLAGVSRGGKGMIVKAMTAMLGKQNMSKPNMSDIHNKQFVIDATTKRSMVIDESPSQLDEPGKTASAFKEIVSGSDKDAEAKYGGVSMYTARARVTFAANAIPTLEELEGSVGNRIFFLPVVRNFMALGLEDSTIGQRIVPEAEGIFMWALEGLRKLREAARCERTGLHQYSKVFVDIPESRDARVTFTKRVDPLYAFRVKHLVKDSKASVAIEDVQQRYVDVRTRSGNRHTGDDGVFLTMLNKAAGYPVVNDRLVGYRLKLEEAITPAAPYKELMSAPALPLNGTDSVDSN